MHYHIVKINAFLELQLFLIKYNLKYTSICEQIPINDFKGTSQKSSI